MSDPNYAMVIALCGHCVVLACVTDRANEKTALLIDISGKVNINRFMSINFGIDILFY